MIYTLYTHTERISTPGSSQPVVKLLGVIQTRERCSLENPAVLKAPSTSTYEYEATVDLLSCLSSTAIPSTGRNSQLNDSYKTYESTVNVPGPQLGDQHIANSLSASNNISLINA